VTAGFFTDPACSPSNDHLALLLEYGLGGGEPWKARMGDLADSPSGLLRGQLRWAVEHDLLDRVRLLVTHGVDVRSRYMAARTAWLPGDGCTAVELAQLNGNTVASLAEAETAVSTT
jgi:hypothetical protein